MDFPMAFSPRSRHRCGVCGPIPCCIATWGAPSADWSMKKMLVQCNKKSCVVGIWWWYNPWISIYLSIYLSMNAYLHTYILTYLHTYILTYILTYLHTYTHTQILMPLLSHHSTVDHRIIFHGFLMPGVALVHEVMDKLEDGEYCVRVHGTENWHCCRRTLRWKCCSKEVGEFHKSSK
jgi:hypothetical protein